MTNATIEDEFDFDYQDIDFEVVDLMMSMNDALASAEVDEE